MEKARAERARKAAMFERGEPTYKPPPVEHKHVHSIEKKIRPPSRPRSKKRVKSKSPPPRVPTPEPEVVEEPEPVNIEIEPEKPKKERKQRKKKEVVEKSEEEEHYVDPVMAMLGLGGQTKHKV